MKRTDTIEFGPHQGKQLKDIPDDYFIDFYHKNKWKRVSGQMVNVWHYASDIVHKNKAK